MFRRNLLTILLAAGVILTALPTVSAQVTTPIPATQTDIANLTAQLASMDARFMAYQQNSTQAISTLLTLLTLMNGTMTNDTAALATLNSMLANVGSAVSLSTQATSNATNRLDSVANQVSQVAQAQQQAQAQQEARITTLSQDVQTAVQNMATIRETIAEGLRDINTNLTVDHLRLYYGVYVPDPAEPNNREKDRPGYVPLLEASYDVAANQVHAHNESMRQHADLSKQTGESFAAADKKETEQYEALTAAESNTNKVAKWGRNFGIAMFVIVAAAVLFVFGPILKERAMGRGNRVEPAPQPFDPTRVHDQEVAQHLDDAQRQAAMEDASRGRPSDAPIVTSIPKPNAAPRRRPSFAGAAAQAPRRGGQ